jgi:lipopolysaccharide/colanic/teichoic acid biosynthesis glycosyltransferase
MSLDFVAVAAARPHRVPPPRRGTPPLPPPPASPPRSGIYLSARSVLEFVAAAGLLVLSAPVMLLAAALVRLTSPGRAIYAQERLGLRGRPYTIYKIRSMYEDCEKETGPCWSPKNDSRVTFIGRILRATHIDELPQLINVLKGEMSLIGPRPERPEIVRQLELKVPRYRERLRVRPGVTGFAQVQLPPDTPGDVDGVRQKLTYDLYYIHAMGPWLDLRILLSTGLKMVGIPFWALGRLFAMPTRDEVERFYRAAVATRVVPQPAY